MARGYGFMAVTCWCALVTAASAQYPSQGGQPLQNPATLPSAEYFTALNNNWPAPVASSPASSDWSVPVAARSSFEMQPRAAAPRPAMPQPPQPLGGAPEVIGQGSPAPNGAVVANGDGAVVSGDGTGYCSTGCCSTGVDGLVSKYFNGYGVPVFGGINQFNRCCPCASDCCGTWGSGISAVAPPCSPFADAVGGAGACATGPWYGATAGLIMWRSGGNHTWLTYDERNNANQLLNTGMANGTFYGGQLTIGRYLGCNHAIEGTYWGFATSSSSVSITDPNNMLGTPIDEQNATLGGQPFGPPSPPNFAPFDGSHQQAIWRHDNIQNGELNFLTFPLAYSPSQRFRIALISGLRYFRFEDTITYGGAAFGTNFGDNGGASEAFLNVRTTNNLLGSQIGTRISYFLTPKFALFATPKMGLYSNMMGVHATLYSGDGREGFNINATSTRFAVMGEIDLGGQYYLTPRFSMFAAYRLIGVSGVATADTQIPPFLVDAAGFTQLNHNDALLLQGVMVGGMWNF